MLVCWFVVCQVSGDAIQPHETVCVYVCVALSLYGPAFVGTAGELPRVPSMRARICMDEIHPNDQLEKIATNCSKVRTHLDDAGFGGTVVQQSGELV